MKKLFIGSDHGGFTLKNNIKDFIKNNFHEYEVIDVGCNSTESCDYPEFGAEVGKKVIANQNSLGIVMCGSGIGISISANKVQGVRCALANSVELAKLSREHNGANVLAMGERTHFIDKPEEIVRTFLNTEVDLGERHARRRKMLERFITTDKDIFNFKYAGFWIRFLAFILDWVFLGIIGSIFFRSEVTYIGDNFVSVSYTDWKILIPFLYVLLFWIWLSATPGKIICRIKIVEIDGSKLSWQKSLIRIFSYMLSVLPVFVGFIWAGFDPKKQTWHDKLAKTYVVKN